MISRTGGDPGADALPARLRPACTAATDAPPRAFTLLELMVVILVIGLLAGILTPVLMKARENARRQWAMKEVTELGAAIAMYHQDQVGYPPDTADWGAAGGNDEEADPVTGSEQVDPRSLHRYLGSRVRDARGEEFQAYMSMDWKRLIDVDAGGIGMFTDPFGSAYQLDAMHMVPPNPAMPGSGWKPCGWPYRLQQKNNPGWQEKQRMVHEFKFVSYGPDNVSATFPFDPNPGGADAKLTKDDIRSWD